MTSCRKIDSTHCLFLSLLTSHIIFCYVNAMETVYVSRVFQSALGHEGLSDYETAGSIEFLINCKIKLINTKSLFLSCLTKTFWAIFDLWNRVHNWLNMCVVLSIQYVFEERVKTIQFNNTNRLFLSLLTSPLPFSPLDVDGWDK